MNPGAKKVHSRRRATDSGTVSRSLFSSIDQAVWKASGKSADTFTTSLSMPPSNRAMYCSTDRSESFSQPAVWSSSSGRSPSASASWSASASVSRGARRRMNATDSSRG